MSRLDLRLGPLSASGLVIRRSGLTWLCGENHLCRAGEVVAFCNIVIEPATGSRASQPPFADERELQVALAVGVAGRLHRDQAHAHGGFLDVVDVRTWTEGDLVGALNTDETAVHDPQAGQLRLLFLAGRRMSDMIDVNAGLLPGWHSRTRAWWSQDQGPASTVLSLGICDVTGVVKGERSAFIEMFEASGSNTHFVFVPDHPLAPCARVLLEQLERKPEQLLAIAEDLQNAFATSKIPPTPADWLFVGALLMAIGRSPLRDSYDILHSGGVENLPPAQWVLLSLNAEPGSLLIHRRLGYVLHTLRHHQQAAGPVVKAWLADAFETVKRSPMDIASDYRRLSAATRRETGGRLLVLNRMSSSGSEDIFNYSAFDPPLGETLANVASKELNIILHELEADGLLTVIDVDALAAALGGARHLPDGVHQSGALQAALRQEILRQVEDVI